MLSSRSQGLALGEAILGSVHRGLSIPAKVNQAITTARLSVPMGTSVPRACASLPPIFLLLTCASAPIFPSGIFREQPGDCSITLPQGLELWQG